MQGHHIKNGEELPGGTVLETPTKLRFPPKTDKGMAFFNSDTILP